MVIMITPHQVIQAVLLNYLVYHDRNREVKTKAECLNINPTSHSNSVMLLLNMPIKCLYANRAEIMWGSFTSVT